MKKMNVPLIDGRRGESDSHRQRRKCGRGLDTHCAVATEQETHLQWSVFVRAAPFARFCIKERLDFRMIAGISKISRAIA